MDAVPFALRAGQASEAQTSGGSDRLSQLFPPATSASQRTSPPTHRIPRAPAPPSFADHAAHASAAPGTRGTRRLLDRLSSLRGQRAHYTKLDDEAAETGRPQLPLAHGETGRQRLDEEDGDDEAIGYDLSGLEGLPLKPFSTTAATRDVDRHLHEAGYAAEFERLEAQLGHGMSSVIEKPFTHRPIQPLPAARGDGPVEFLSAQALEAQEEAEKTGRPVVIPVDISDFTAGNDFNARSIMTVDSGLAKDEAATSYFFPEDPEQPSWRPFSMGRPWLSLLIVIALALAGLQEFLCQLSLKRVRDDPNGGLVTFKKPSDLSMTKFFTWKYAPIMTFVFYGIMWQMTDFEVKRLEPYYQLSKKAGATAGESLNIDYLTFASWLVPLRALRHKQYAVIYSSVSTLVASSLVPVLQSASINTYPPKSQRDVNVIKAVRVDPPWSRAVTASLLFVAFSGAALMWAMRRKSGLQSDPKGIAGIAAMATKSHILADFHGLDAAPLDKIHKQLQHRRYILHKSSLWQGEFIRNSKEKVSEHGADPRPLMLRKRSGFFFVTFMIGVTVSIPIFMFLDTADVVTEKLPFLMTALATVIRILWNTMNCDIRMLQPFYILSKRHAPAKTLTLDYAGTNPLVLPLHAMYNRHWIIMLVAFGSILAELLTVCVSSISVNGKNFIPRHDHDHHKDRRDMDHDDSDQTTRSFWASFVLTMSILIYLIAIALLTYTRRSHKFMPRQIGTIASVLAFIHQSKMLLSFINTEKFDAAHMTKHLEKNGKKYALGWINGRNGDMNLGIDEEEVLKGYVYGVDWTKSKITGHQVGAWEHYETR
jgi:hypothetical protein